MLIGLRSTTGIRLTLPAVVASGAVQRPSNTLAPSITGIAQVGQILTVNEGNWSGNPTFAYQWLRNGAPISGSINKTRILAAADLNAVMSCIVTGTNAGGAISTTTGNTAAVIDAPVPLPVNTSAPVVTGTPGVGNVLTVSDHGVWTNSPTEFDYQWRRNGVNIAGETASTYNQVTADAGQQVTCRVTATNAGGSVGAISNAVTFTIDLNNLGLTPLTSNQGIFWTGTITGITSGSTVTAWASDGSTLTVSGNQVTGIFSQSGDVTVSLTETNPGGSDSHTTSFDMAVTSQTANSAFLTSANLATPMAASVLADYAVQPAPSGTVITVDKGVQYQPFLGVGAAMTDSSVYMLLQMSDADRAQLLQDTFGTDGFSMVRLCMGSSDFYRDTNVYTYNDVDTDGSHTHFSVQKDIDNGIVGICQQILAINPNIKFFATPWTLPIYAKKPPNGSTTTTLFDGWVDATKLDWVADYFVKFIQAYQAVGIPIYAVSPQNEPFNSTGAYPMCAWHGTDIASFIKSLGPKLAAAGLNTKIWNGEDDSNHVTAGIDHYTAVFNDATAMSFVDSVTIHGYSGDTTVEQTGPIFDAYPQLGRHFTEFRTRQVESDSDGTAMGLIAGDPIAGSFRTGYNSVTLWNYALDQTGQPTPYSGNRRGVVTINSNTKKALKSSSYYILAHIARFVKRGAIRIKSNSPYVGFTSTVGAAGTDLETVSFLNPDKSVVTYFWNPLTVAKTVTLLDQSSGKSTTFNIPALSVMTVVYSGLGHVPLTVSGNPGTTGLQGGSYSFTPSGSGGDGLRVWSINKTIQQLAAQGLIFNTKTGTLSSTNLIQGNLAGIVITATDDTGSASLPSFDLIVTVPPHLTLDTSAAPAAYSRSNSATWTHQVDPAANLLIVAIPQAVYGNPSGQDTPAVTSMTANGVAMNRVLYNNSTGTNNTARAVELWALSNPPTGAVTLVANYPRPTAPYLPSQTAIGTLPMSFSFFNAAASPIGDIESAQTTTASGAQKTLSVTSNSPANAIVLGMLCARGSTETSGAGQTVRLNGLTDTNVLGGITTQPGGSGVTTTFTINAAEQMAVSAVAILSA